MTKATITVKEGTQGRRGPRAVVPRAALVISLDFELHWGVRDIHTVAQCRDRLLGGRQAVPAMLRLFERFDVHATWATVGFLFFASKRELLDALPARTPAYDRRRLSPYLDLESLGESERDDPFHFAPSLIRRIAETPRQEIGTHTLSHYYCLEAGQSPADFREDLAVAQRMVRSTVGRSLASIVFPRNQVGPAYVEVCGDLGLIAYRGNPRSWAYRARSVEQELLLRRGLRLADAYAPVAGRHSRAWSVGAAPLPIDIPASRYLRPYAARLRHLEPLRLRRIEAELRYAAEHGQIYHLWWHPEDFGTHLVENLSVLERILTCFAGLREAHGMRSLTMEEAAREAISLSRQHASSNREDERCASSGEVRR